MLHALQTHIQTIKTWVTNIKAEWSPLQELKHLGELLWQLK